MAFKAFISQPASDIAQTSERSELEAKYAQLALAVNDYQKAITNGWLDIPLDKLAPLYEQYGQYFKPEDPALVVLLRLHIFNNIGSLDGVQVGLMGGLYNTLKTKIYENITISEFLEYVKTHKLTSAPQETPIDHYTRILNMEFGTSTWISYTGVINPDISLSELGIPTRMMNAFTKQGFNTLGELLSGFSKYNENDLRMMRQIGEGTLSTVKEKIAEFISRALSQQQSGLES